jgi:Phosphotransferase enzyme family
VCRKVTVTINDKDLERVLPLAAAGVTADWLEHVIQERVPGARIRELRLDDTWQGTATKLRVTVEANDVACAAGLPPSLVVKGRFSPEVQFMQEVFEAEVMFYRDLAPDLDVRVPACFFAGGDRAQGQHIVVLEDLNCRNVEFQRVIRPIGYEPAARFLDNMAKWHARFWNSAEFAPGGRLADLYYWDCLSPTPAGDHGRRQLEPDNWAHHMNLPRGIGMPKRFRDRDWMFAALDYLNAFGRTGDRTLLHGDHHLGNLYIEADGNVGVLDWQSPSQGAWSHDMTYFIVSALDIEDRRRWDTALIGHYLDRLTAYGVVNPPTLDEALHAFRIQLFDGLFYWAVNPVEWQAENNNCAVVPRFAVAALDYDSAALIDAAL